MRIRFVSPHLLALVCATWALVLSQGQNVKTTGSLEHTVTATRTEDNKSCYPLTKCKPCSKLEAYLSECLTTGYKQLEYCTSNKKKKFAGCHYSPDFNEERLFWTFEIICSLIGAVAYWVVYVRRRNIEKMVARRIQRQINA